MIENTSGYYSARQLAGLPGLPGTERQVRARAAREKWAVREAPAPGGPGGVRHEYSLSALPPETQAALLKPAEESALPPALPVPLPLITALADWQTQAMDARLGIIVHVRRVMAERGIRLKRAVEIVVSQARGGTLPEHIQRLVSAANARLGKSRALSSRSIHRWLAQERSGTTAVAPRVKQTATTPPWAPALLKTYRKPQKPALTDCVRYLRTPGLLPAGVTPPSYDQARTLLRRLGNVEVNRGRMGQRELLAIRPFARRDTSQLWPGDVVVADGHTWDAEVGNPRTGLPIRPEIVTVIDVATRKAVGFGIGLAEGAIVVLDALKHACKTHGIPAIFYVDNGSGFKNDLMKNPVTGFMARLGIQLDHSIAYRPQSKGIVERFHRTVWVRAAKMLPTYMGKDMDPEAKTLAYRVTRRTGQGLPSWDDFLGLVRAALDDYNHRPHRGLLKITDPATGRARHQTPKEAWDAALTQGWQPLMPEEDATLWMPEEIRTVARGEVSLMGQRYFSADLAEFHGERMRIAFDIHDPSRVWVMTLDGVRICEAGIRANSQPYKIISYVERADHQRQQAQVRRLENKALAKGIDLEREERAAPKPLTLQEQVDAQEMTALAEPAPAEINGRPRFSGDLADRDWALWVRKNGPAVTDGDRLDLAERLKDPVFRELVGFEPHKQKAAG